MDLSTDSAAKRVRVRVNFSGKRYVGVVTVPDIEAGEGDELEIAAGRLVNQTTGKAFAVVPLPKSRQAIIDAGGLIAYTRRRMREAQAKA